MKKCRGRQECGEEQTQMFKKCEYPKRRCRVYRHGRPYSLKIKKCKTIINTHKKTRGGEIRYGIAATPSSPPETPSP